METLAFALISLVLQCACLARLVRYVCTHCKDVGNVLRRFLSCPHRTVSMWITPRKPATAQELLIASEVLQLRVLWARRFLAVFCVLSFSNVLSMQQSIFLGRERWMSSAVTWGNISVFAAGTLTCWCPAAVSARTLAAWYGLYMLFALMYITPWFTAAEQAYTFSYIVLLFFRLPCSIMCNRISLALFFNLLFVLVMCYRSSTEDLGNLGDINTVLWTSLTQVAVALLVAASCQSTLSQRVELNIQRKNAQTQLSAAQALLRLMCDAVVELDDDLRLTSSSPELAALLLSEDATCYKGMKLTDLMPEVEARRASQLLGSFSGRDTGRAGAFHTRMVDSCLGKICVELLQVTYDQMDGQRCHLIGIRDFVDQQAGDMDAEDDIPSTASGPEEEALAERKNTFLDLDMIQMRVIGASAPVDHAVGMGLSDLFPAHHTVQLLQRLQHEAIAAQGGPLRKSSFLFENMPVCFGPGKGCHVSGTMQVMKTCLGPSNVLLSFAPPVFQQLSAEEQASQLTSRCSRRSSEKARPLSL